MTAIAKKSTGALSVIRPGEGTCVDLQFSAVDDVGGQGATRFTADISAFPVPAKRYSADVAFVGYSRETVKVLFGQERYQEGGELRTLLIVKMTPQAVAKFLLSVDDASPPFGEIADQGGYEPEALVAFSNEPKDTVAFDANWILAGVNGREGCCDFYHASPFAMAATAKTKKLAVDPVVRVDLRASLLLGVVKELRKLLNSLPPQVAKEG